MPDSDAEGGDEGESYREAGESGRNGHRLIETDDLQEKHATG
jgi:hypothetical protein